MTYGVPYSFVPGTKAKANEVNANFIDVLDKIQTTNARIDTANTNIQSCNTALATKLNADFSNVESSAQTMLDSFAKNTDLDGVWTAKYSSCALDATISIGSAQNYSLSNILPSDNNIYEVIIGITAQTAASSGALSWLYINTDNMKTKKPLLKVISRHSSVAYAAAATSVIVGTGRSITITNNAKSVGVTKYDLEVYAYRKVR